MSFSVTLAQINSIIGNVNANTHMIQKSIQQAIKADSDLIVFPECALTGYPLYDLTQYPSLHDEIEAALKQIIPMSKQIAIVLGYPKKIGQDVYNCAGWFMNSAIITEYFKQSLVNHTCFDEVRVFKTGLKPSEIITYCNHRFALSICNDIWTPETPLTSEPVDYLINLSASPFHMGKRALRHTILKQAKHQAQRILYVNAVGGQDGLVFDGGSQIIGPHDTLYYEAAYHHTDCTTVTLDNLQPIQPSTETLDDLQATLCLGLKDYLHKNHLNRVCLGLSGGIDSALVAAIAVDALGSEHVTGLWMPSPYSSTFSYDCVQALVEMLDIQCIHLPITPAFECIQSTLNKATSKLASQNLQARLRGLYLMQYSNTHAAMALACSNKSELAMGYSTLYGDLVGGIAPIADLTKTQVYTLSRHLNKTHLRIPEMILNRAPTAELAPHQFDTDDLPPYETLDPILEALLDPQHHNKLSTAHADQTLTQLIRNKLHASEFKRKQLGVIIRTHPTSFNLDRRYPTTYHLPSA